MVTIVIIDDDKTSVSLIKKILLDSFKRLFVTGEAYSVSDGISVIRETKPDLVLLDIEMPDGDAFDVLNHFENPNFGIIFITSHQQYAIRAIKLSALDYVLKPINKAEIIKAVNKFMALSITKGSENRLEVLKQTINDSEKTDPKIILPINKEFLVVKPEEIVRCQADSYYSKVFLRNGKSHMVSKTLRDFESLLEEYAFIRIHNSHLINMNYVTNFIATKESEVKLKDGVCLPVSRRKKERIKSYFKSK